MLFTQFSFKFFTLTLAFTAMDDYTHVYKYITLYVYNKNKAIKRTLKHVGINIKERN